MPPESLLLSGSRLRLNPHVIDVATSRLRLHQIEQVDSGEPSASPTSRTSIWALVDQGVVSLGNCATNVLLARSLGVQQFGVFSILLEAMLFLNTLQASLVIYPLSVRGAVLSRDGLRRLAGTCLLLTLLLALPLAAILLGAGAVVGSVKTGMLAGLALGLWQCQETLRRAMMAHGGQNRALPGDSISYLGQAAAIFFLSVTGLLTVDTAFITMMLSSAAALIVQTIQIGPVFSITPRQLSRSVLDFWRMGRWVVMGNLTLIVTTLGCSWTLVFFHGADAVGRFQALANLLKLSNPLTICMAGLIVPAAARAFNRDGLAAARAVTLRYGLLTAAVLAPYYLLLVLLPTSAIHLLYGSGSPYAELGNPLRAFVLWYAALFVAQLVGCFLNAIEQSRRGFVAQLVHTAAVIVIALPLTAAYGLDGLMLGGVIGNLTMAACYVSMMRRSSEKPTAVFVRRVSDEMRTATRLAA